MNSNKTNLKQQRNKAQSQADKLRAELVNTLTIAIDRGVQLGHLDADLRYRYEQLAGRPYPVAVPDLGPSSLVLGPSDDSADPMEELASPPVEPDICGYCHTRHWGYEDHHMA